ncbi:taste receptor type 1 member 3-like [Carassius carassius]|uniref:taste receptor type 1 member 3-like n=1 Tax=Carassius carassius TaxID=217509 RepID=UPI0028693D58|nr:taste receptor type 1 member 3-like [Carassius carassius]
MSQRNEHAVLALETGECKHCELLSVKMLCARLNYFQTAPTFSSEGSRAGIGDRFAVLSNLPSQTSGLSLIRRGSPDTLVPMLVGVVPHGVVRARELFTLPHYPHKTPPSPPLCVIPGEVVSSKILDVPVFPAVIQDTEHLTSPQKEVPFSAVHPVILEAFCPPPFTTPEQKKSYRLYPVHALQAYIHRTSQWLRLPLLRHGLRIEEREETVFTSLLKVNYGATSYALSDKRLYPSFVRTIPSNKDLIEMIIHIIRWFGWNWVAFLGSQDDYSSDGLKLFNKYINNTGICLAYQDGLSLNANYGLTLKKIDKLKINVIVVFALPQYASKIIKAAIANNIQDKVWIASQAWAMNQQLPRELGIGKIGTIIGITERLLSLPGFNEFVYKISRITDIGHNYRAETGILGMRKTCNQVCDYCSLLTAEEIINENPTFSFAIYAAIYTIAHALHKVLQCDMNECHRNTMAKPYMLLKEISNLDFPLNGRQVKYNDHYDPTISYAVVLWRTDVNPPQFEMVGTYDTHPEITFSIDNSLMPWHNNGSVIFSNCSIECKAGYSRQTEGFHSCCFSCKKCPSNSYVDFSRAKPQKSSSTPSERDQLRLAHDWKMLADIGRQLVFPPEIATTTLRPDMVLWSLSLKKVFIIELTVPWKDSVDEAYERKHLRYADLAAEARHHGWNTEVRPVEVGCRGFVATSTTRLLRDLGIKGQSQRSAIRAVSEAAEGSSQWLWMKRKDPSWAPK